MLSSAAGLMKIRAQVERDSGVSMKLFGFIAESVFTIIPESCSGSPRNSVRHHPGIAFALDRIPHLESNTIGKRSTDRLQGLHVGHGQDLGVGVEIDKPVIDRPDSAIHR